MGGWGSNLEGDRCGTDTSAPDTQSPVSGTSRSGCNGISLRASGSQRSPRWVSCVVGLIAGFGPCTPVTRISLWRGGRWPAGGSPSGWWRLAGSIFWVGSRLGFYVWLRGARKTGFSRSWIWLSSPNLLKPIISGLSHTISLIHLSAPNPWITSYGQIQLLSRTPIPILRLYSGIPSGWGSWEWFWSSATSVLGLWRGRASWFAKALLRNYSGTWYLPIESMRFYYWESQVWTFIKSY